MENITSDIRKSVNVKVSESFSKIFKNYEEDVKEKGYQLFIMHNGGPKDEHYIQVKDECIWDKSYDMKEEDIEQYLADKIKSIIGN